MAPQVTLPGRYYYVLIDDINNPENTSYKKVVKTEQSHKVTRSTFQQEASEVTKKVASESSAEISVGGAFKFLSASVNAKYQQSEEVTNTLSSLQKLETDEEFTDSKKVSRTFNVGPGASYQIYQQMFQSPGINVQTETIKAGHELNVDEISVEFDIDLEGLRFLDSIDAVYGDDQFAQPDNAIAVVDNKSGDTNAGFEGKYIYLVPKYSDKVANASTYVQIIIQEGSNDKYEDLASGAGGSYRYLKPTKNTDVTKKITDIALHRATTWISNDKVREMGYDGISDDINAGRGGDYLRLIWKVFDIECGAVRS